MQQQNNDQFKPRKNHQIRASQVRLINSDGSNLGVVSFQEATRLAKEQDLDLVEIGSKSIPIVVKITDYGKFLYEAAKKAKADRKSQQIQEQKEITLRPTTDTGDLNHKLGQVKEFLGEGSKVKLTVRFRGREISHPQVGRDKIDWMLKQLEGLIVANPLVSLDGKLMSVIVSPSKSK